MRRNWGSLHTHYPERMVKVAIFDIRGLTLSHLQPLFGSLVEPNTDEWCHRPLATAAVADHRVDRYSMFRMNAFRRITIDAA